MKARRSKRWLKVTELKEPEKELKKNMQNKTASMLCPVCNVPLSMSDRQGVEVDYYPQRRGVWLDRGELDKIIERGTAEITPPQRSQKEPRTYGGLHGGHGKHGWRRKSWLHEWFD